MLIVRTCNPVLRAVLLGYCTLMLIALVVYYVNSHRPVLDGSHDAILRMCAFAVSLYGVSVLGWGVIRDVASLKKNKDKEVTTVVFRSFGKKIKFAISSAWSEHPIMLIAFTLFPIVLVIVLTTLF